MRFSASIFFHESVSPGPLSGTPLRLFRIFQKFTAIFVNECLSAVLLTPVDKREEFYHLACWLKIDLLVNFLNYFIFVLLIILHHTVEYAQLQIFIIITVFAWIFFELFPTDLKSASNSALFYTHIKMLWKKYLWGHISTFTDFES